MAIIETINDSWKPALQVNQAGGTYTGIADTMTKPSPGSASGVFETLGCNSVMLQLLHGGSDNGTVSARVEGIEPVSAQTGTAVSYSFTPIAEFVGTAGQATGIAGAYPGTADRYCDGIAKIYGTNGVETVSPNNNLKGLIVADVYGFSQVRINLSGTASNALVKFI